MIGLSYELKLNYTLRALDIDISRLNYVFDEIRSNSKGKFSLKTQIVL